MTSDEVAISQQDETFLAAAQATVDASSLEEMTRPLLELLHRFTGLDSTYLTEVRVADNEQEILYAENKGSLNIPEGLVVEWRDTLCRRALLTGDKNVMDVPTRWPDSQAAAALGIQTYVSVPVTDNGQSVIGTLCGISNRPIAVKTEMVTAMEMIARLIADQWQRDRRNQALSDRADLAESRLRERAMFLAEAEHKLKSPLTILRGWSQLLDDWRMMPAEQVDGGIKAIRSASERASNQVDELLAEARSEVMSTRLTIVPLNATEWVRRVAYEVSDASAQHAIAVEAPEHIMVKADEEAFWQVLWHIAENALKYSPDGGLIHFSLFTENDIVTIAISDEGIGIPTNVDVFAPFVRSDSADKDGISGSGLGLHIVRTLVMAMSGSVTAKRLAHRGTVMTVRLPSA